MPALSEFVRTNEYSKRSSIEAIHQNAEEFTLEKQQWKLRNHIKIRLTALHSVSLSEGKRTRNERMWNDRSRE